VRYRLNKIDLTKAPVNYDFASNWDSCIVPVLFRPDVQDAIEEGVNGYIDVVESDKMSDTSGSYCYSLYKQKTAPASYSTSSYYSRTVSRLCEIEMTKLKKEKKIPAEYLTLKQRHSHAKDPCVMDDLAKQIYDMKFDIILAHVRSWDNIKTQLLSYVLLYACHWYNPSFMLTLAKIVEPGAMSWT
jgi:hypothetical protein